MTGPAPTLRAAPGIEHGADGGHSDCCESDNGTGRNGARSPSRQLRGRDRHKRREGLDPDAQASVLHPAIGLLTVEEAARALRVSSKTVRRWISAGRLVAHRIG